MAPMLAAFAEWDPVNARFILPRCCPHPGCGQPVEHPGEDGALDWCAACNRPFAHWLVPGTGPDTPITRRAAAACCPFTGHPLTDHAPLCWAGTGGGPGHSHAQPDPLSRIFGAPARRMRVVPALRWQSAAWESGVEEPVLALSVHRGLVIATSASGRLGVLDPADGAHLSRSITWPDNLTQSPDPEARVSHPPALRAGLAAIATRRQLCIRPVQPRRAAPPVLLHPAAENRFHGPPVALALCAEDARPGAPAAPPDAPAFAIIEGRTGEQGWRGAPHIRVFRADGAEAASAEALDIARPPLLLPASRHAPARLLWVDTYGALTIWTPGSPPVRREPASFLHLPTTMRPTIAVAPDDHGSLEVWIAWGQQETSIHVARAALSAVLQPTPFQWSVRPYPVQGVPIGLAVGWGSPGGQNPAGDMLAVTLESATLRLSKSIPESVRREQIAGSFDPPVLCGAGILVRVNGSVRADATGIGWSEASQYTACPVDGLYEKQQGIALYGRSLFVGVGAGVACIDYTPASV